LKIYRAYLAPPEQLVKSRFLAFDRFAAKVLGKEESNMRAKLACDNFQVNVSIFKCFGALRTADLGLRPENAMRWGGTDVPIKGLCGSALPSRR
jgi:hypothetical protein